MAECVISAVDDATGVRRPACLVHAQWAPCWHHGQPAAAVPLHLTMSDRDAALRYWRLRTRQARPLVLHRADSAPPLQAHLDYAQLLASGASLVTRSPMDHVEDDTCWCTPETIPAQPVSSAAQAGA